jgi:YbgC/YbaW family acyl-CoA thioester hydrolase
MGFIGYTYSMVPSGKISVTVEMPIMSFETDFQGIVNNTEFIRFLERVHYALAKKLGFSFQQVRTSKVWTVMAHVEINYISSARFEEVLLGQGWVEKIGHTSLTLGYEFRLKKNGRLIADAKQVLVFVNSKLKPTPIPRRLLKKL